MKLKERSIGQRGASWANDPEPLEQGSGGVGKQPLWDIVLAALQLHAPHYQSQVLVTFGTLVTNVPL